MKNNCVSLLLLIIINLIDPSQTFAGVMSNNNFRIQLETVTSAGTLKDSDYNLRSNLDDKSLDSYSSQKTDQTNEKIDTSHLTPFVINVSSLLIDFGKLTPTNPIVRSLNISISHDKNRGYSVITSQNQPFFSKEKNSFIPNTSCDNGKCNNSQSGPWTNTLVYGSGYRCENKIGTDCSYGFSQPNFFKSFADRHENENPSVFMRASFMNSKKTRPEVTMIQKVNISGTQLQAGYSNNITIIGIPYF